MADWQRTLDITTEWNQCKADEITVQECAKAIAEKVRAIPIFSVVGKHAHIDDDRNGIADQFDDIAGDPTARAPDLNAVMRNLYDWGDTALDDDFAGKKVCWIATF